MKYRNTITDMIVETKSKIIGGNWEEVTDASKEVTDVPDPKKKEVKKDD